MATKVEIQAALERVIHKMKDLGNETDLVESCPISIIDMKHWEWAQGVGLYGLMRYYEETQDATILRYLVEWYDDHISKGLPDKNVNTMCPMLTLSYVYEHTGHTDYLKLCAEWADWIMREMPRTAENGLQHVVSGEWNEGQLWDDTLFMTVLFLARMGKLLKRKDYVDESVRQFLVHLKYLIDKQTGLLLHGWSFAGRHNFADARWARGNCWYTAVVADYVDILGDDYAGVGMYLLDTLQAQVQALEQLQTDEGMWTTLLDDPLSYGEASATAGFAYGILRSVRLGYLAKEYKQVGIKAAEAVLRRIDAEGTVLDVSYGTGMGKDLDYYREIPRCPMTYGQALTVLMLTELYQVRDSLE
jgi:unsaturated rhamnogalacturonyl hydrolase